MKNIKIFIIGLLLIATIVVAFKISDKTNTIPNVNADIKSSTPNPTPVQAYTMVEVATHNNKQSCWTTISGSVYDLTSWISAHPGGEEAILSICGIDGTTAFEGQHGGQARPASELSGFKIGALK